MLLVTTALSGLMAGLIQTAPPPVQTPQSPATPAPATQTPAAQTPAAQAPVPDAGAATYELDSVVTTGARPRGSANSDICLLYTSPSPRDRG